MLADPSSRDEWSVSVDRVLAAKIDDLFLPDAARLSDRTRAGVRRLLAGTVAAVEGELRGRLARTSDGVRNDPPVLPRLIAAGLLRDPELAGDLIARVELDRLFDIVPPIVIEPGRPSLLVRWTGSSDPAVASASRALLVADSRRRDAAEGLEPFGVELRVTLYRRLVWQVAAAIREQDEEADRPVARDQELADAAMRVLGESEERDGSEAAAAQLADAVDAASDALGPLLLEAVADRRATLFTALLARAVGSDHEQVRGAVIDSEGDRLAFLLHAAGVDRDTICAIGVALAAADPRRDLDKLADAAERATARDRDAPLPFATLPSDAEFRAAVRLLAGRA